MCTCILHVHYTPHFPQYKSPFDHPIRLQVTLQKWECGHLLLRTVMYVPAHVYKSCYAAGVQVYIIYIMPQLHSPVCTFPFFLTCTFA